MKGTIIGGALALLAAGCASEIKEPVTGQMAKGIPMTGQAIARLSGNGEFWVETTAGFKCGGNYNSLDTNTTITIPVFCTDGASGEVVATRRPGGTSGTAVAKLKDGRTGQFVFGDLKYDEVYGAKTQQPKD